MPALKNIDYTLSVQKVKEYQISNSKYPAHLSNRERRKIIVRSLKDSKFAISSFPLNREFSKRITGTDTSFYKATGEVVVSGTTFVRAFFDDSINTGEIKKGEYVVLDTVTGKAVTGINSQWGRGEYYVVGIALADYKKTSPSPGEDIIPIRIIHSQPSDFVYDGTLTRIRNDTGESLKKFQNIACIGELIDSPTDLHDSGSFTLERLRDSYLYSGVLPDLTPNTHTASRHSRYWGVAIEDIDPDKEGFLIVSGRVLCKIFYQGSYEKYHYVTPKDGSTELTASHWGAAEIIYSNTYEDPSDTFNRWVDIRIGTYETPEIEAITLESIDPNSSGKVHLKIRDESPDEEKEETAWYDKLYGNNAIPIDNPVMVKFYSDTQRLSIINAKC